MYPCIYRAMFRSMSEPLEILDPRAPEIGDKVIFSTLEQDIRKLIQSSLWSAASSPCISPMTNVWFTSRSLGEDTTPDGFVALQCSVESRGQHHHISIIIIIIQLMAEAR